MEKQISMFDTGVLYDTEEPKRPCDYSFVREVGMKVRRWRTGEILEITEIHTYYTYLSDGSVATPYDICKWVDGDRLITIPDDVWKNRCKFCVHKCGNINFPVSVYSIDKPGERPCNIIRFFRQEKAGECPNFHPDIGVGGICYSCMNNNQFFEGFCTKADHAEQRRVYYGGDFGGDEKKRDYWGRHVQSVCDDYRPYSCVKEYLKGCEQWQEGQGSKA